MPRGGIFCGVTEQGILKKYAFDCDANRYDKHPDGTVLEEIQIPGFEAANQIVKNLALRISKYCKMASWDLCIDESSQPIFIEVNMAYGQLDFHQMTNGPLFKDITQEIMKDVFLKKGKKTIRKFFK